MRPLFVVALLVVLLFATAAAASAHYVWNEACGTTAGQHYYTGVLGWTETESTIDYTPTGTRDVGIINTINVTGGGEPHAGMVIANLYRNWRLTSDPGVWYIMVFAENSYPESEMQIRLWSQSPFDFVTDRWSLTMLYDAGSQTWGRTLVSPEEGIGSTTAGSLAAPWFSYTVATKKSTDPINDWGYIFELRPVPEPSALAALAIGLSGMALSLRRFRCT